MHGDEDSGDSRDDVGSARGGLRLDAVGRRYGPRGPWVLRDVTLGLPPASLIRVTGANGSGKSTLLRIAAGVDRPTAGRVTGRPAHATAYVPERFPPALPFPVLRYLLRLGAIRGLSAADARERALHWLDRFGIADHARTPMDELSKGTCQKVAVAQALLADPQLLVLDEAWTGLDTDARDVLDAAVCERVAAGATVLFVDHDPRQLAAATTLTHALTAGGVRSAARRPASGGVVIEASGGGEVPGEGMPAGVRVTREGASVRIDAPGDRSDHVLRALLGAAPAWHIEAVRARPAVAAPPPVVGAVMPAPPVRPRPTAAALFRYQAELLLRSHRWLPPLVLYGAVMAIGVLGGEPMLGSFGYAAALLLPVAAWMVRAVLGAEPGAAQACVASAVGPVRARRWALLAAAAASAVLGVAGTLVVASAGGAHTDDRTAAVSVAGAVLAGAMAAAVSVLLGTAVGTLTNPPFLPRGGWSVLGTVLAAGAVLVLTGSPAQAAVTNLVTSSRTGTVHYPWLPLLTASAAATVTLALAPRRPPSGAG